MNAKSRDDELLTSSQVARLFGVSPSTVNRWARNGLIRCIRTPGGHYRFPAREIERRAGEENDR
jgi:excisionase family DNA binding protein